MVLLPIVVGPRRPTINAHATTSMWHYVIRVNHVTVYRIIRLNYFNITESCAIPFPLIRIKINKLYYMFQHI